ncbi:MAG: hypothetical protein ACK482_01015 [Aphanizomenon sp.]
MESNNNTKKLKKFTYGDQFDPNKFSLIEILELCKKCQPNRDILEASIAERYFSQHSQQTSSKLASENIGKLAMNCFLSIRAYQLIEDLQESRQYKLTSLAEEFLSNTDNSSFVNQRFAGHMQKDDIEAIKKDKTSIVEILDKKARRVFSKKELDISDEELNEIEKEEDSINELIEDD